MSTPRPATLVDQGKLASLANEVEADGGTRSILLEQDFMTPDALRKIADAALPALGHVDIPVNNADGSRHARQTQQSPVRGTGLCYIVGRGDPH